MRKRKPRRIKEHEGGVICLWFSLFDLKGETDVFAHMGLIDSYSNRPRKKAAFEAFKSFVSRWRHCERPERSAVMFRAKSKDAKQSPSKSG